MVFSFPQFLSIEAAICQAVAKYTFNFDMFYFPTLKNAEKNSQDCDVAAIRTAKL